MVNPKLIINRYLKNKKTIPELAKISGVTKSYIIKLLKDNDIVVKKNKVQDPPKHFKFDDIEFLESNLGANRSNTVYWKLKCNKCGCQTVKLRDSFLINRSVNCKCHKADSGLTQNRLFNKYINSAKRKKTPFNLSKKEFFMLTKQNCFYCDSPPNTILKKNLYAKGQYIYNGIDRKDNFKGYSKKNCVPCCGACNRAKNIMGSDEFLELVSCIYHKHF